MQQDVGSPHQPLALRNMYYASPKKTAGIRQHRPSQVYGAGIVPWGSGTFFMKFTAMTLLAIFVDHAILEEN